MTDTIRLAIVIMVLSALGVLSLAAPGTGLFRPAASTDSGDTTPIVVETAKGKVVASHRGVPGAFEASTRPLAAPISLID